MKFIPNFIMALEWYDEQSLKRINHIISKSEDRILYLVDDSEKIDDVSKMPDYIQKDYITYNSRDITEENVNILIKKLEWWCGFGNDETSGQMPSNEKYEEYMSKIQILKNIKRDIKIKKLLS
jgi:hypothetical protein